MLLLHERPRARPHFGSAAGTPRFSHWLSPRALIFSTWRAGLRRQPRQGSPARLLPRFCRGGGRGAGGKHDGAKAALHGMVLPVATGWADGRHPGWLVREFAAGSL